MLLDLSPHRLVLTDDLAERQLRRIPACEDVRKVLNCTDQRFSRKAIETDDHGEELLLDVEAVAINSFAERQLRRSQ